MKQDAFVDVELVQPGHCTGLARSRPVILLTGRPGVGKTTVIKKVISLLGSRAGGFYTREVRSGRKRVGFEIVTLSGRTEYLASKASGVSFGNQVPFGSYRVNLDAMDSFGVPSLLEALDNGKVIVVDEIGPMEISSQSFRNATLRILNSDALVIGTIVRRPYTFADMVKAHPRVTIKPVTLNNRDSLPLEVFSALIEHTESG